MSDLFHSLNNLIKEDMIFWFCGLSGTALFMTQLILNFFGASGHSDIDRSRRA